MKPPCLTFDDPFENPLLRQIAHVVSSGTQSRTAIATP